LNAYGTNALSYAVELHIFIQKILGHIGRKSHTTSRGQRKKVYGWGGMGTALAYLATMSTYTAPEWLVTCTFCRID